MNDQILAWMRGNRQAAEFILAFHSLVETWDDLIDKDKPVDDSRINEAFMSALIQLPRNDFYRTHFSLLNPIIESAIYSWFSANKLKAQGDEKSLREAYVLRCACYDIYMMCARIVGGVEHAVQVNLALRSQGDSWEEYLSKHEVH